VNLRLTMCLAVLPLSMGAAIWFWSPTAIPAKTYVGKPVSTDTYIQMKKLMLTFAAQYSGLGITAAGDSRPIGSIGLYCRGTPLATLVRLPGATTLIEFSPETARGGREPLMNLHQLMVQAGPVVVRDKSDEVGIVDSFYLDTEMALT